MGIFSKNEIFCADFNNEIEFKDGQNPDESQFYRHCHSTYEILFLMNGEIDMQIEDNIISMKENDIVIIKPNHYHVATVNTDGVYARCVIHVNKQYLENIGLEKLAFLIDNLPNSCFSLGEETFLSKHYNRSFELISLMQDDKDRKNIFDSLLFSIYTSLAFDKTIENVSKSSTLSPLTKQVLKIIEKNISEKSLSLDFIAEALFVSKSHMCNVFGSEMGIGIKQYVKQKRISMAKEMIDMGESVKTTCEKCGYSEYSTFYRAYCSVTGTNPQKTKNK